MNCCWRDGASSFEEGFVLICAFPQIESHRPSGPERRWMAYLRVGHLYTLFGRAAHAL